MKFFRFFLFAHRAPWDIMGVWMILDTLVTPLKLQLWYTSSSHCVSSMFKLVINCSVSRLNGSQRHNLDCFCHRCYVWQCPRQL